MAQLPNTPGNIETIAVHAGADIDPETKAVAPPIHLSTTFAHPADVALLDGYIYQRYSNPTQERLEQALAALEAVPETHSEAQPKAQALFFATGLAAAAALLHTLSMGDRVLMAEDTYFAIRKLFISEGARMGIETVLVDMTDHASVQAALAQRPALLWCESPSNPLLKVTDLAFIAQAAKAAGTRSVCDATFSTPLLLKPLQLGIDVVLHSSTKYLSGHSDNMGGSLTFVDQALYARLFEVRKLLGATASPFSAWLTLRGIRTLPCRMEWHCKNARAVAAFLSQQSNVRKVHYPGLSSHPQHAVAKAQMRDFGGMVSFEVQGSRADAIRVASKLQLFTNATSLGSVESLVEHRASAEGPESTTPDTLLRLSIGLEHADDLIADLAQALAG
jgi:cystathionine gamma-synthase